MGGTNQSKNEDTLSELQEIKQETTEKTSDTDELKNDYLVKGTLRGHSNGIYALCIMANGIDLASGSSDSTIRIWSLKDMQLKQTLTDHTSDVLALALLPSNGDLVSGSADHTVKQWSPQGNVKRTLEGHTDRVGVLRALARNDEMLSASDDKSIRLWSMRYGSLKRIFQAHTDWVRGLALLADDMTVLASSSGDGTIKIWCLNDGTMQRSIDNAANGSIESLVALSNGRDVAASSTEMNDESRKIEGWIKVWCTEDATLKRVIKSAHDNIIWSLCMIGEHLLASASADKTIKMWNLRAQEDDNKCLIKTLRGSHTSDIYALVAIGGNLVMASGSSDKTINIWSK